MAEERIESHVLAYNEGKRVVYAITLKNGDLIGVISLVSIIENHQAELGYRIVVPYWNQGF